MAAQSKVLFLLFEGLAATVVESQVLANVRLLQARNVARFEVWAFACLNTLMQSSQPRRADAEALAQAPVHLFRALRPLTLLAYVINVLVFAVHFFPRRREFTHIHARTDYSAAVAGPVARLLGIRLIWDCRGDSVAEVEERFAGRGGLFALLLRLRSWELAYYARLAGWFCHGAIFVTEELRELHHERLGDRPTAVIPCAAHESYFFFDPELRSSTRAQLGYQENERVFVYSGSLTTYQCFEETLSLFAMAHAVDSRNRLLVLTPDIEGAQSSLASLPAGSFQVHACMLEEVNAFLNAADVGFLLRQPIRTNHVASPTKFAEYGLAGLGVVTTEAVPWAYRMADLAGNLVSVGGGEPQVPTFDRAQMALHYRTLVGRMRFIDPYNRLLCSIAAP